jgi:LuxR family transcriptional regulator, maltose regulon positive regulatory protein
VPHPLPARVAASLAERTDGWAAGLRLVALAVQPLPGQDETEQYLTSFTGSHRPVLDYLVSDVYGAQPQGIQAFLLQRSILDSLTGPRAVGNR